MLSSVYYQQQQQQAAILQQYNTAAVAAAAAAGYPQYVQYPHNPLMPPALYSQPSVNSYAFQPQPQQLYAAMPSGQSMLNFACIFAKINTSYFM